MKGKQQKVLHKGTNDKVNAFITLLYPYNGIKFNTSRTRNSDDFINHIKNIKRYVLKRASNDLFLLLTMLPFMSAKRPDSMWKDNLDGLQSCIYQKEHHF